MHRQVDILIGRRVSPYPNVGYAFAWFMMFGMSYENLPRMGIVAAQASGIPLIGGAGGRGGRGRRTWCLQAYPHGAQRALTMALLAEPRQGWEADATV